MHLKYGPAGVLMANEPEQCGKIIKYLTHALEIGAWRSRGISAARGGKWSAVQVSRLLEAARSPFDPSAVAVA